ncbi:MAG: AAA family ATPase [Candidatus Caccovivens sp.]
MNITITGKPCSGKSTTAKLLEQKRNFRRIGVGDIFKQEAEKRGMSAEEFNAYCLNDPSYDFLIDEQTAKLGEELKGQNIIFDSRLAWHFVPESFKVFVDINEDEMVNRLVKSERKGKEKVDDPIEAKRTLINRRNLENERYKKIYGIDNNDLSQYDFVIDSSNLSVEEVEDAIWNAYQTFLHKLNKKSK